MAAAAWSDQRRRMRGQNWPPVVVAVRSQSAVALEGLALALTAPAVSA